MLHSVNKGNKTGSVLGFIFCFVFLGNSLVMANVNQMKLYKAAFPGSQPKCTFCHIDKLPKKDEGMHEPSAYGKKVRETATENRTAETFKQIGTYEDFEAQQNQAQPSGQ